MKERFSMVIDYFMLKVALGNRHPNSNLTWNFYLEISCKCFNDVTLKIIPSNHIYYQLIKKTKNGLVIGHMGNIFQYQENTLEGMKNLVAIKADGMHMKVQLTKDSQLILFGDDNLYVSESAILLCFSLMWFYLLDCC